jgi:hypothetical protein
MDNVRQLTTIEWAIDAIDEVLKKYQDVIHPVHEYTLKTAKHDLETMKSKGLT